MRRQTKVAAANREIVQVRDMRALAPHLHEARMIVALVFDPTRDVGRTPARRNHQARPRWSEYSRLRSFEAKPGCPETSEEEVVQMYAPAEMQLFDFVGPTQGFCETERLCGVSRVIVRQYPHNGIAVKAAASFAGLCDFSPPAIARMHDQLPVFLWVAATRSFEVLHPPGLRARALT